MAGAPAVRNNSSSLRRALAVLDIVASAAGRPTGASLTELATGVTATKSTVLRLLAPLLEAQLVRQDSDGTYRIGLSVLRLAGACLADLDVRTTAHPILRELAQTTGYAAHLLMYDAGRVTYVDKVVGSSPIQMASRIGDTGTAYSTASGKAMLAYLGDDEIQRVIDLGMPARTPFTITDADQFRSHLVAVRARGCAYDDLENEDEIRCVAAPVFDHAGTAVCAISISGPSESMSAGRADYTALTIDGARRVSQALGHSGGAADA